MLQAVSGGGSPTVAEYGHAIAQYQLWAYASRPGVWGIYKKDAVLWPCILYKRYLAESNCSPRFCRPLPNRSAKVPFTIVCAKVVQIIVMRKFLGMFFSLPLAFGIKSTVLAPRAPTLQQ